MPGYLVGPTAIAIASDVVSSPTGDVVATNVQNAIAELAAEKATVAAVAAAISSVEGVALLGL